MSTRISPHHIANADAHAVDLEINPLDLSHGREECFDYGETWLFRIGGGKKGNYLLEIQRTRGMKGANECLFLFLQPPEFRDDQIGRRGRNGGQLPAIVFDDACDGAIAPVRRQFRRPVSTPSI